MAKKVMTKADLVEAVAKATGVAKKMAAAVVDAVISEVGGALAKGTKVQLTGFGTFEAVRRKKRTARNIRTGETINIPATVVPRFRPGALLKERVASKK
jgi:DNA-binding protein HU-beta